MKKAIIFVFTLCVIMLLFTAGCAISVPTKDDVPSIVVHSVTDVTQESGSQSATETKSAGFPWI